MKTELIYLAVCPWVKLPYLLNASLPFSPASIVPSRDAQSAVVEFHPSVSDVSVLSERVNAFVESIKLNDDGKEV